MRLDHPPGVICIASGELARYPHFTHSMLNVLRPKGTQVHMGIGLNVAANFNSGVRQMMATPGLEWVWIMGDDHEFDHTTLLRLLDHELDIVVPLVVRRQPPFIPVLFKKPHDDTPLGQFPPFYWHELPPDGLIGPEEGLYTCGSAGMLIRRHVIEAMPDPWFEMGKMGKDLTNEDTFWCKKVQDAGFKIYADCSIYMDHWTPISLRPVLAESGEWTVALNLGGNIQVQLPPSLLRELVKTVKEQTKENFGLVAL